MPFMSLPSVLDSDRTLEDQANDLGVALAWNPAPPCSVAKAVCKPCYELLINGECCDMHPAEKAQVEADDAKRAQAHNN
jgi:hypothetical protein